MYLELAILAYMLGNYAYHRLHDRPPLLKPEGVGLPRVDEGSAIPLIYGRVRVRAPVMAFAGIYEPADPGTPVGPGNTFDIAMMFVVGVPFFGGITSNVVTGIPIYIYSGDVRMAVFSTPPDPSGNPPGFFAAGTQNAGSELNAVSGEIFNGAPTQNVGAVGTFTRLAMIAAGIDSSVIPGYRNFVCVSFVSQNVAHLQGLSMFTPQVPAFSFEVKTLSTGTASDLGQSLVDDADPAAVIYDLLTSPWGRLALPASKIDLPSFQACSATLFAENHGYSRAIEQATDATEIIDDILRQIDGVLYEEPTTGKLVLKLIRNDYNVNTLDTITPDNAKPASGSWLSVTGWNEAINQVRVSWTNRNTGYNGGVAIAQNAANVFDQGIKLRTLELAYVGCCTPALAQQLAARELAVVSKPTVKASVTGTRAFYQHRPGDAIKLTWPQLGITGMVMRIGRVDLGQLHKGEIQLDLIRDAFDVTIGGFPYV